MSQVKLSRRTLLRGAGVGIGLPVLEAMLDGKGRLPGRALAAAKPLPTCFITFFTPNGLHTSEKWWPVETGTAGYTAPDWMSALVPFRDDFTMLSGLQKQEMYLNQSINIDAHIRGHGTFATGVGITRTGAGGISVDQVVANKYGLETKLRSLPVGIGKENIGDPRNGYISWAGANQPVPAERDPDVLFRRLFGGAPGAMGSDPGRYRKSVLDAVRDDATTLQKKVGAEDKKRLAGHLDALRDLENQIEKDKALLAACKAPTLPAGATPALSNDRAQLMMKLLVTALTCDVTRVSSYQLRSRGDDCIFNWIGMTESHHTISHYVDEAGVAKRTKIWLDEIAQFAFFLKLMKETTDPTGGSLLDRSLVFFSNENGSQYDKGDVHNCGNMLVILAGKAGGKVKTGLHVRYKGQAYSSVFVNILNDVFAIPTTEFGVYGKGRLDGFTNA